MHICKYSYRYWYVSHIVYLYQINYNYCISIKNRAYLIKIAGFFPTIKKKLDMLIIYLAVVFVENVHFYADTNTSHVNIFTVFCFVMKKVLKIAWSSLIFPQSFIYDQNESIFC